MNPWHVVHKTDPAEIVLANRYATYVMALRAATGRHHQDQAINDPRSIYIEGAIPEIVAARKTGTKWPGLKVFRIRTWDEFMDYSTQGFDIEGCQMKGTVQYADGPNFFLMANDRCLPDVPMLQACMPADLSWVRFEGWTTPSEVKKDEHYREKMIKGRLCKFYLMPRIKLMPLAYLSFLLPGLVI